MQSNRIVLDTNCLLACLSSKSDNFRVWKDFQAGRFILCVSNDILEEYQEIIEQKTSSIVAKNVIDLLLKSKNVEYITPHFKFGLIVADHDDDKFVDCAFAANATYIVSDDSHFDVLKDVEFPRLLVLKLKDFLGLLQTEDEE